MISIHDMYKAKSHIRVPCCRVDWIVFLYQYLILVFVLLDLLLLERAVRKEIVEYREQSSCKGNDFKLLLLLALLLVDVDQFLTVFIQ
jgi:hypothetical protein